MKNNKNKNGCITILSSAREVRRISTVFKEVKSNAKESSLLKKYFAGLKGVGERANSFSRYIEFSQSSRLRLQSESFQSSCVDFGGLNKRG